MLQILLLIIAYILINPLYEASSIPKLRELGQGSRITGKHFLAADVAANFFLRESACIELFSHSERKLLHRQVQIRYSVCLGHYLFIRDSEAPLLFCISDERSDIVLCNHRVCMETDASARNVNAFSHLQIISRSVKKIDRVMNDVQLRNPCHTHKAGKCSGLLQPSKQKSVGAL
jgi:hypothetical protein